MTGDVPLAERVLRALEDRAATLAVAESLTGGLVGARLTAVPGSSVVFRGGVVAYATDIKASLLEVDAELLAREGAVHPQVAREMAVGVRRLLDATYGLALTGVAGPEGQDGRPPGTVHVAVAGPNGASVRSPEPYPGSRGEVRESAVRAALDLLLRTLTG